MDNIFLTSLTVPEVRQVIRQELDKYFTSNKIVAVIKPENKEDQGRHNTVTTSDNLKGGPTNG